MPYWLHSTLQAFPAFGWIFFGLGLPWALTVLPRKDWHDRPLVLYLAFALGPAILTAWMFFLSSVSTIRQLDTGLLTLIPVLGGTIAFAFIGMALAWRKHKHQSASTPSRLPFAFDEKILMVVMGVVTILRLYGMAFWPFTAYDALWVYGYEGRLYTLLGHIPTRIDYYPQFIPLQYTFAQLFTGGIDDHAARTVIPFIHIGSMLGVYILGSRLFSRRVGIFAAAIWTFYPGLGEWSRFGDLEVALAFLFSGATAFFLMAWRGDESRRRYAAIAGLLFSIGMWTKPTMGAFALGVMLLVAVELVRLRLDWRAWRPRFELAFIAGLVSLPLGAVWYLRNVILGHAAIDFPPAFWRTLAERSGEQLGWIYLAVLVLLLYLYTRPNARRPGRPPLIGFGLMIIGMLPSVIDLAQIDLTRMSLIHSSRLVWYEWLVIGTGAVILIYGLRSYWHESISPDLETTAWVSIIGLPYFVVWFHSFSYHYRLSFAIVPLLLLPTAVVLAHWLNPADIKQATQRYGYVALIVLVALPGALISLRDVNAGWAWEWPRDLPDDFARYQSGNAALMDVVNGLQVYIDEQGEMPVVAAPGVERLSFFFPTMDIRIDETPTTYDELNDVTYFVYGVPETRGAYEHIPLQENQVIGALSQAVYNLDNPNESIRRAWWEDDGIFNYTVYELHLDNRFNPPQPAVIEEDTVIFGDFVRYYGHDIGGLELWPGRQLLLTLHWEVLSPAAEDYAIYVHLRRNEDDSLWATWDGPVTNSDDTNYYATTAWQAGEFIADRRTLALQDANTPREDGYKIVVGFYRRDTGERVPVTINGEPAGDGYVINDRLKVIDAPE